MLHHCARERGIERERNDSPYNYILQWSYQYQNNPFHALLYGKHKRTENNSREKTKKKYRNQFVGVRGKCSVHKRMICLTEQIIRFCFGLSFGMCIYTQYIVVGQSNWIYVNFIRRQFQFIFVSRIKMCMRWFAQHLTIALCFCWIFWKQQPRIWIECY